jgi:protein required for attachment to host cells
MQEELPSSTSEAQPVWEYTRAAASNGIMCVNVKLRHEKTNELVLCAAPVNTGEITRVEFHSFVKEKNCVADTQGIQFALWLQQTFY